MFTLTVVYPENSQDPHVEQLGRPSEVLLRLTELLEQHAGCERVDVVLDGRRLFSIDCEGNRLA